MAIMGAALQGLAADTQSLDHLKLKVKQDPDEALRAAAKQFEAVFLNMLLKSMREATPQEGMFDSEQTRMFTGMLDQQFAQSMSERGIGLAEVMVRQLSLNQTVQTPQIKHVAPSGTPSINNVQLQPKAEAFASAYRDDFQQAFVSRMRPHAELTDRMTGISPALIMGQAALESGWGRREINMADGKNSHNLFGIKAGKGWQGKVAEVATTEYHNGVASKQVERFRAYDSYAEAFQDYARLLMDNKRYSDVLGKNEGAAFAQALQQAGYATDPRYADKLAAVIASVQART